MLIRNRRSLSRTDAALGGTASEPSGQGAALHHQYGFTVCSESLAGGRTGRALPSIAHRSEQFGQDYGVLLKEGRLLQRAVVVIDRTDRVVYAEYVADQMDEPDYARAVVAAQQAAET